VAPEHPDGTPTGAGRPAPVPDLGDAVAISHASLLDRIGAQAVDPDYRTAARRRPPAPPAGADDVEEVSPRVNRQRVVTIAVLAVFTFMLVMAARQQQIDAPLQSATRESLIARVKATRDSQIDTRRRVGVMRTEVQELRTRLQSVSRSAAVADDRAATLAASAGFGAATGPGVEYVLDDAASRDGGTAIRDQDLAVFVDGLWEAGAEGIAINGRRLTPFSAIRNAGGAINVNGMPLVPPYKVDAIGDPQTLPADFVDSTGGGLWQSLVDYYGFRQSNEIRDSLELPAASRRLLARCTACGPVG
jgi:uncharacterized protein YlxW (UPF0749 family)